MTNREALNAFYNKALTVNTETTPEKVLTEILADNFVSKGSVENKIKEQLIGQLGFFWKLIPDLKWEPQEILNEGSKFIVRSLASGTPNGDFMGLPTDGTKSFSIMTIDIHTIIEGQACSAATLLSIVGKKRFITKNSYMLLHHISSECWGKLNELEDEIKNLNLITKNFKELYKQYSNIRSKTFDTLFKKDLLLDARTCLNYGLVDEII